MTTLNQTSGNTHVVGCIGVVIAFVILAPVAATTRWSLGFLPFIKRLSLSQAFDSVIKKVVDRPV